MAETKRLTVSGYVIRNRKKIKREKLPIEEQKRLATAGNNAAMKESVFIPVHMSFK